MRPPNHTYSDPDEMVAGMLHLVETGRCGLCRKQMPGMIGDSPPDKSQALIGGFDWLSPPDSEEVALWRCPECIKSTSGVTP